MDTRDLPLPSQQVWLPKAKGYEAQTVGMVQIPKGTLEINRDRYLGLLMCRVGWMLDKEDPDTVQELLSEADNTFPGIYSHHPSSGTIVDAITSRLYQMGILSAFQGGPAQVNPLPNLGALQRIKETSLEEWLNLLDGSSDGHLE